MIAYTAQATVSPVTNQELADWLKQDDAADPLLPSLLLAATEFVISWLQRDLLTRTWELTYSEWPQPRQGRQLHYGWPAYNDGIELPYTQLVSVDSVVLYGETLTNDDYFIVAGNPARIRFKQPPQVSDTTALVATYKAGYGLTAADVPQAIRTGITMIAAYMHEHAGACDASEAMTKSGAAMLLHPYRVRAGLAI